MNRQEILEQISIYEGYRRDARARGEYDVAEWYEKTLSELRVQLSRCK